MNIERIRGMSEPFPFTFNVSKVEKIIICHSIIFTSYEVRDGEATIALLREESDPRMPLLLKFIWSNFLKDKRKELEECLKKAERAESITAAAAMGSKLGEAHK